MTNNSTLTSDSLSVLMDAELAGTEKDSALEQLLASPQEQALWHVYHVAGDVLRSEDLAGAAQDLQFLSKLQARLAQEPEVPLALTQTSATPALPSQRAVGESANSALFKWRAVAGAACTVLAVVLGSLALAPSTPHSTVASTAASLPFVTQNVPADMAMVAEDGMIRDPRLDQFLSAHQQLGGHSALQMPSGFLRNATYERAGQ